MPLVLAPLNQELKVIKILTSDKVKKHLENLGITIDSKITVLSKSGGNIICIIKDGRLALDETISHQILVA